MHRLLPNRYSTATLNSAAAIFALITLTFISVGCQQVSDDPAFDPVFHPVFLKVTDQVDAFNKRDVARLVDNVSDDFKWFYLTPDSLLIEVSGREEFRASMESYFESTPPVASVISAHAIDGNRMSFQETVSYKSADGTPVSSSAMGIYQVDNDEITRAWYFID